MKKTLSIFMVFILCIALASFLFCFGPSRASTNNSEHNTFYEVGVMEKEYGLTSLSNEPEDYIFYGDTIQVSRRGISGELGTGAVEHRGDLSNGCKIWVYSQY